MAKKKKLEITWFKRKCRSDAWLRQKEEMKKDV